MPKMKTKRLAKKKMRVNSTGKVKFAGAGLRHNTGKKSAKKCRQLCVTKALNASDVAAAQKLLPYEGIK